MRSACGAMPARSRLVVHDHARRAFRQPGEDRAIVVGQCQSSRASTSINDEIGALDRGPRALDADALDRVVGLAQARGVDHGQRNAGDLDAPLDGVARRAGNGRDDRGFFAREAVQEARLADVRPAREHDRRARRARAPRSSPGDARARASRATRARRATTSPSRRNSMSSSGKSSVASV